MKTKKYIKYKNKDVILHTTQSFPRGMKGERVRNKQKNKVKMKISNYILWKGKKIFLKEKDIKDKIFYK